MKITWCYPFNMYSFKIHGISGEREITSDYSKYITSEKQMRLCGRLILFLLFLLLLCFISFTVFILNIWIALLFCYKTNILKSQAGILKSTLICSLNQNFYIVFILWVILKTGTHLQGDLLPMFAIKGDRNCQHLESFFAQKLCSI